MKNKIEQKVNDSFTNATPDISNRVIADCQAKQVRRTATAKRSNKMTWKLATFALAFVLVITGIIGGLQLTTTAQAASVTLDVNPSIELKLDGKNRVIEVVAHNDDGEELVSNLQLDKLPLDDAIVKIIDWLTENGYLTEDANSVLISVDTKKETRYDDIVNTVTGKIDVQLGEHNIQSSIIAQWITDKDIASAVGEYVNGTISLGKATLIQKIVEASEKNDSVPYSADDLANLKVNDLALILARYTKEDAVNKISGIITKGEAHCGNYVNKKEALATVLTEVGLDESDITNLDVDFDIEKGVMVYEFEFTYGDYEYEIDIQAGGNNAIVKFEKEKINPNKPTTGDLIASDNDFETNVFEIICNNIEEICGKDVSVDNIDLKIENDLGDREIEVSFATETHKYEVTLNYAGEIIGIERELITRVSNIIDFDTIKDRIFQKICESYSGLAEIFDRYKEYIKIDYDFDEEKGIYEVEIEFDYLNMFKCEFEVEINATNGKIIKYETDSTFDLGSLDLDTIFKNLNSSTDAE